MPFVPQTWLTTPTVCLPETWQSAAEINAALDRPAGWLESHAGIQGRRTWAGQDPLQAAAEAGRNCLNQAGLAVEEVGALLVTSEAPPLLTGLAAALHHRLDLYPSAVALEVGGACNGFLSALWLAKALLPRANVILVIAVEAPSTYLRLEPGPAGEAAALFGDGAAATALTKTCNGRADIPVGEIVLGVDGAAASLVQVAKTRAGPVEIHLDGVPLAQRAVRTMAQVVQDLVRDHGLAVADLKAVVAHGGNGRLPGLLARQLGLPSERVWSESFRTGNLGSVSLPVAWAAHEPIQRGPVVWTSVGAGITWGAAITGIESP